MTVFLFVIIFIQAIVVFVALVGHFEYKKYKEMEAETLYSLIEDLSKVNKSQQNYVNSLKDYVSAVEKQRDKMEQSLYEMQLELYISEGPR